MSDSKNNESAGKPISWKDIVLDLLILVLIMSAIGFGLKQAMNACTVTSPIENIAAAVRKGGADTSFLTELGRGLEKHKDFVNLKDDNGRTTLMWACYANSIDPDVVLDIDMARLPYVLTLLNLKDGMVLTMKDGVVNNVFDGRVQDAPALSPDGKGMTLLLGRALVGVDSGIVLYETEGRVSKIITADSIDTSAVDNDGFSPLHWAAWSGLEGVMLALVENGGFDINKAENLSLIHI